MIPSAGVFVFAVEVVDTYIVVWHGDLDEEQVSSQRQCKVLSSIN